MRIPPEIAKKIPDVNLLGMLRDCDDDSVLQRSIMVRVKLPEAPPAPEGWPKWKDHLTPEQVEGLDVGRKEAIERVKPQLASIEGLSVNNFFEIAGAVSLLNTTAGSLLKLLASEDITAAFYSDRPTFRSATR